MAKQRLGQSFRQAAAYAALITLGLLSIGCGKKATSTSSEKPTMTVWQSDFSTDSVDKAIKEVDAQTVVLKQRQLSPTIFESRSVDAIAADAAPDIWLIPDDWLEDHKNKLVEIPNSYIQPNKKQANSPKDLTDYFNQNYDGYLKDRLLTDNGAVGLPGPVKPLVLFVNTNILSDSFTNWRDAHQDAPREESSAVNKLLSSPITTWDDLVKAVKLITVRDGDNITTAGIALGTSNNVPNLTDIFALLDYQQGNDFIDIVKQTALFNGFVTQSDGSTRYPGRDALTFITNFADPTQEVYTWNADMPNAREAFLDGQVAMLIDYPDFADVIKQQAKRVKFDTFPVPQLLVESQPTNVVRFYLIGVTKASIDRAKAASVAISMGSSTNISQLVRGVTGSYTPFKNKLSQDKEVQRMFTGARLVYKKHHSEFDAIIGRMIDDVSIRQQATDAVINQAANDITLLLQRDE